MTYTLKRTIKIVSIRLTNRYYITPSIHKTSMLTVLSLVTYRVCWIYWNKSFRLRIWVNWRWYVSSYNYYEYVIPADFPVPCNCLKCAKKTRFVCPVKHSVKSVHVRNYSGSHFLEFELNTERYSVSLRIQSTCGKIRTRITPNTDTFYAV